jgi:hypothetical protein
MTAPHWTDDEKTAALEMLAAGKDDIQVAAALGRTENQVRHFRRRRGMTGEKRPTLTRLVSETPERLVFAPEESDEEPVETLWERCVRATTRKIAKTRTEGVATIRLLTDSPVAVSISSDWHITPSGSCDLVRLRTYAEAIQQAPGAYAVAVGDLTDNPVKWNKNMDDIPDEARLLDLIFGVFGSKLLATTDGNHDAWSKQFAGLDNIRRMASLHRVHYAPDELVYLVELASPSAPDRVTARYVIATRHQYRRNSSLNWSHAAWRWAEDNMYDWPKGEDGGVLLPDIIAIGHNHAAEVAVRDYEGGKRWAARMGPFQVHSSHARQFGWSRGTPTCPTFLLYPHRAKPVEGYADYDRALEILTRERAEWALGQAA